MSRTPAYHKRPWKPEEDAILARAVGKYGCPDKVTSRDPAQKKPGALQWSQIAAMVPNRVAKQCRERWRNHLDPAVSREEWTPEEEAILQQRYVEFGGKWSEISKDMPGRPDNACKNQWNKLNGKGRYVMPADKKPKPPTPGPTKRSHHKKPSGTTPRKHRKVVGKTDGEQGSLVLKVPLHHSDLSETETEAGGDLSYRNERDYFSDESDNTQVGSKYREEYYDVQASLAEARARGGLREESELTGYGTGTTPLEGFSLGQHGDGSDSQPPDEIPASGDGHLPAPFAWTDPQLPVEEPVSTVRPRLIRLMSACCAPSLMHARRGAAVC
jgi:hypothetical protein